jgi:Fe2+ transport system protein FeoA
VSPVRRLLRALVGVDDDCPGGPAPVFSPRCGAVDCDAVPLTALAEGESATVTCLEDAGGAPASRLAALGVLPGAVLVMLQCTPAYVFRLGHAELAVDAELACRIRVRRPNG